MTTTLEHYVIGVHGRGTKTAAWVCSTDALDTPIGQCELGASNLQVAGSRAAQQEVKKQSMMPCKTPNTVYSPDPGPGPPRPKLKFVGLSKV